MPELQELVSPENKQVLEEFLKGGDYLQRVHEDTLAEKAAEPTDIYADAHPNVAHEYANAIDDPSAPFTFPESAPFTPEEIEADKNDPTWPRTSEDDAALESSLHDAPRPEEPLLEAGEPEPLLEASTGAQKGNWLDQIYTERAGAQSSTNADAESGLREIRLPQRAVNREPFHASNVHEEEAEPEHREIVPAEARFNMLLAAALTAVDRRTATANEGKSPSGDDVKEFFTQFEQFKNEGMDPQSLEMIQELFTKAYDAAPMRAPEAPQLEEAAPPNLEAPIEFVRPGSSEFRTLSTESVKIEPSVAPVEAKAKAVMTGQARTEAAAFDVPEHPAELEANETKLDKLKGFWNRGREWVKDAFRPSETGEKWKAGAFLNPYYKLAADASTWVAVRRSNYEIKMANMDEREREIKLAKGRLAFTAGIMVVAAYKIYQINQGLDSGHSGILDAVGTHGHHIADGLGASHGHSAGAGLEQAAPLDAPSYMPDKDVKIDILPGTTHVSVTEISGSGSGSSVDVGHDTVPSNATMHPHGLEALATQESFSVKSIQPNEGGVDWFKRMGLSAKTWYNHVPEMDKLFGGKELRMSGTDLRLNHEGMVSKAFQEYIKKLKEQG